MVRVIASIICALLIWQLFRLNRESDVQTSKALWIPVIWLFLAASRNVSEWLQYSPDGVSDQYLEGSPLDRAVLTAILALGVIVLLNRTRQVGILLRSNLPILLYFLYCGISVLSGISPTWGACTFAQEHPPGQVWGQTKTLLG